MAEGEPRKSYTGWIILGVIVLFLLWGFGSYNSLVSIDTKVEQRWGNVQTAYQRRADLIPNLVAVVQQYSDYEGALLKEVTKSRASIGSARTPAELQSAG
ncbi:MAG: LemA family protein, partial [Nanoarchaeota archaeon]